MKFIHTADIHFGMENYGRIDPSTGIHSRLLDFERALTFIVDTALEENIDFFLFSGDAYKTATPSPTQQKLLMNSLFRLYKAGIPVIIIVGNHDNPLSFGKATALDVFSTLPLDGFHVFSKPRPLRLETKSGPVQIVGIPWPSRTNIALKDEHKITTSQEVTSYLSNSVTKIIRHLADELDPHIPSVLAGHLTVSSGIFSGSERRAIYGTDPLFLPSQLGIKPFDYVALGHLHRYQNLNEGNYPAIIYSGSPERVDFGERNEEKGFCLVNLIKDATTHEFIKTPTRDFIQFDIELNAQENQTEQILEEINKKRIAGAIIKIIYYLPADVDDTVDLKKIQRACQEAMYLVGIFPIRPIAQRKNRSLNITSSKPEDLFVQYIMQKESLASKKDQLLEKLAHLQNISNEKEKDDTQA
jgi:exonuclease SbcD